MTLIAKANAIKAALSLPPDMAPVAAIGAACEMMGHVPERGTTMPAIADALIEQIGCAVETPSTAPATQPPPDSTAAAATYGGDDAGSWVLLEPVEALA